MGRIIQLFSLLALIVPFGVEPAQAFNANGHAYSMSCNADGYVLTSDYPVARHVENGANSSVWTQREPIYLGKSCDAHHPLFGNGKWCWGNGGFAVNFQTYRYGFARQELYCPNGGATMGLECRCG